MSGIQGTAICYNPAGNELFTIAMGRNGELGLFIPLCPWNLGGDRFDLSGPLSLKLLSDHFTQTTTSKNGALWAEHHWNLTGGPNEMSDWAGKNDAELDKVDRLVEMKLFKTNKGDYQATQPLHERVHFVRNLITLELILDALKMHGFLEGYEAKHECLGDAHVWRRLTEKNMAKIVGPKPVLPPNSGADWVHPRIRKANNSVEPLHVLLKRLEANKKIVTTVFLNAGDPISAVREYTKIVMELYPWTASPLFFSNDDAFHTGLAQFESDLWAELGVACIHALRLTNHFRFATAAADCGDAILNFRYTTYTALSKACFPSAWEHTRDPLCINQVGQLIGHKAVWSISSYILAHTFRMADKKDGAWAHKHCYDRHVCQANQYEGYVYMLRKLGEDAINFPHGNDAPPAAKVDASWL